MIQFQFADLHCHPTLKTFGKSFSKSKKKSCIWYCKPPNYFLKLFQKISGITKFSQSDFKTMSKGQVRIAFVSFYPFEKGFFRNPKINNKVVAKLASFITSIGYNRVRFIQKHSNYFDDLINEYNFLLDSNKAFNINGKTYHWEFFKTHFYNYNDTKNKVLVIPTIEGAHVFNSGLSKFGKPLIESDILANVQKVKKLSYPPLFVTFAHNFNNDLCGHAPSLEPLKGFVDQSKNLDTGFSCL